MLLPLLQMYSFVATVLLFNIWELHALIVWASHHAFYTLKVSLTMCCQSFLLFTVKWKKHFHRSSFFIWLYYFLTVILIGTAFWSGWDLDQVQLHFLFPSLCCSLLVCFSSLQFHIWFWMLWYTEEFMVTVTTSWNHHPSTTVLDSGGWVVLCCVWFWQKDSVVRQSFICPQDIVSEV